MSSDGRFFDLDLTFVPPVPMRRGSSLALMIIDMQYHDAAHGRGSCLAVERIKPGSMAYFTQRVDDVVIPEIQKLLAYFREHKMPVIYVTFGSNYRDLRDVPERLRGWFGDLERRSGLQDLLWSGTADFEIRDEVKPKAGEVVINKTTFGAFSSSNIDYVLRQMQVQTLVITGVSTNCCVESTARDAADRGYGCVIVDKATADYDAEAHDATLRAFYMNYGRISENADEVIRAIDAESAI
ncbi:MAG: cysteine hydrolase [Mesorhizobium sp.]|uniref:cysteine hydrolase family protein n=1 Tax=unclassified Mesorhizobium TaxID=325217 RepID=UPI000FCC90C4|nr:MULTISPECIES: isochorismatase family cysteine hydrolase [unclassified Mesorhizobium]RUW33403.1 cysteine hydrolase [Mesorhizobium sp. M2A.F.Ca.ET.015.02.1.1]RVC87485.1 cysteine hydrolase [Mesorhizobium sp. M2A.F.Ca.ET.017.03.2.1]RVC92667.1 cysteine hydrolase [Mesorhizobium sp. M2A.F.Ca.ET.029.05.1.1]RWC83367.1 MAG: cysteine hydrolase [Mesorhizobium sp.]RWF59486.1 MAG: cysteine hydrolase [Mesorhizobium sp.]